MGKRRHYIDNAVGDKLKDYREAAPAGVWEGVAEYLDGQRRRKKLFLLARVAAAAVIVLTAGTVFLLTRDQGTQQVVTNDQAPLRETVPVAKQADAQQAMAAGEGPSAGMQEQPLLEEQPPARETGEPAARETGEPPARETGEPAARETGEPAAREQLLAGEHTSVQSDRDWEDSPPIPAGDAEYRSGIGALSPRTLSALPAGGAGKPLVMSLKGTTRPGDLNQKEEGAAGGIVVLGDEVAGRESNPGRWSIGTQVAPGYSYRNLGPGSEFTTGTASGPELYDNIESGMLAYTGGVNVNYEPAGRLTLQSGIYYSKMGLNIDHAWVVPVVSQGAELSGDAVKYNAISNSSGRIAVEQSTPGNRYTTNLGPDRQTDFTASGPESTVGHVEVREGVIIQDFEYLEVPMIVKYRMVDRKLGVNFLGGVSTHFLVGSDAYFIEEGNRDRIGETTDLKTMNYSSTIGLGMDYALTRDLYLNVDPFFKYYLNSVNRASGIKSRPYTLGIYTGISYRF